MSNTDPEPAIDYAILDTTRAPSNISPKVSGSLAAGALATVAVFVASQFGLVIPTGVEAAIAVLVSAVAGYVIPDNR